MGRYPSALRRVNSCVRRKRPKSGFKNKTARKKAQKACGRAVRGKRKRTTRRRRRR